jgi:AraC family transcriptional regulator of adaptative response / DNA-3-methyladenine glycosylase II
MLRLRHRGPLDWDAMLGFLARRAIPGVEAVDRAAYRRTIEVDGRPAVVTVARRGGVRVDPPDATDLAAVARRAARLLGLDVDVRPVLRHLGRSPRLAPLVARRPGLRVPGAWDAFELAVRAVLGQQVTVMGATTLAGRLVRAHGRPVAGGRHGLTHVFPGPEVLADADLSEVGLPRARARTIRALAAAVAEGRLDLAGRSSLDADVARLCAMPGFGPWTAHYVAMRALRHPDAFPATDLGLRRALGVAGRPRPVEGVVRLATPWRPWRAYAVMHLWSEGEST